jgi:hypothetical protein
VLGREVGFNAAQARAETSTKLAAACLWRPQGCDFKQNENDAFRFECALKTHEGFLEADC